MKRYRAILLVFLLAIGFADLTAQNTAIPLILPEWHQTAPWNRFCPGQGQNRAHAGSHALAMAKTMKYWAHPSFGVGSVSYVDDDFGTISENFNVEINWGGMSNTLVFATTQRFIATCGIASLTNYEYDYSTSSLLNVKHALINHFVYDDNMQIVNRENYSAAGWAAIIRQELDNRRPVIYSISNSQGVAVAFILDAYDDLGRFHANFSAENMPNDWLLLENMVHQGEPVLPSQQSMLFGIQPSMGPDTISENFENGFGYHNWQFSGNTGWTISTEAAYYGSHSAKSGNVDHNQSTSMFIVIDVSEASTISFYKKVSCESEPNHQYDHLRFEIDGVEQERWSGNGQWGFHEYPVSPGVHTFKWTYAKDGASTYFSDCAWVDAITLPPGITPLMPPRFLSASLSELRNVVLSWTAPEISDGLLGYKIFRNNSEIAQFNNPQMVSFTDYNLPNGDYTYYLRAVYGTGLSIPGNSSNISVEVPYAPINLSAVAASYSSIQLAWQAPPLLRDRALLGYKVFRDDQLIATLDSPTLLSYHDMGLNPGVYYYQVSALYTGAESPRSNTAMGVLGVAQPPANLQAIVQGNDVLLSWSQVLITESLLGFKIFRNNLQIAHLQNPNQLSYLDENLANGTYSYFMRAVYEEVESGNSATVIANVEVPYPPTNLIALMIDNDVQLQWQRPPLSRALTHYYIYRDGQVIGAVFNPNNTSYTDHDLAPGIYTYYVTAFYSGVESPPSNIASTGTEPLLPPQGLGYTLVDNDVELSWQPPVIYDRDLTGYRVWRNESVIADNHPTNIYLDANLPNGTYQYKVAAIYTDGISEPTPTIAVTVAYALPPTNLQLSLNSPEVQLSWQAPASGPSPDSYRVYRNSVMLAETSQPVYTDLVPQAGSYTYYVTALYGGVESAPSNSVTEFVNLAPQTPVLTGQTLGNSVVLNIDRGFVPEGYEFAFTSIFRNGELLINFVENDFYIDNDLPNGNYSYYCYSVYGFEHPYVTETSNTYSAIIDLVYAPSNLSGTLDGTTISLNWDGVYSPLRPISYKIYRNGAVIAQTADTNYADEDLPGGNYSYYVTALFGTQESGRTNILNFYVEELLPPTNLTGSVVTRDIHLSWSAPILPQRDLLGYRIWRNGAQIVSQTELTSYIDSQLANGTYQYHVAAIYSTGISEQTAPLSLTISYAPAPQNLSGSVENLRVVSLIWSAPGDVDADYYKVYRNGTYLTQAAWEAAEDMPTATGTYTYTVSAVYGDLESSHSNPVNLELNLNPTTILLSGDTQGNSIQLDWSVLQAPPSGVLLRYEILRNSIVVAESTTETFSDPDLSNGIYEYSVRAVYDWYGLYTTALSNPYNSTIDLPYPPQGLEYSVIQNNVLLTWEPVSSILSPVRYNVYRNGSFLSSTTSAAFNDNGLANGTYSYHVTTLFGEAESLPSASVWLTIEIPYAPQELSAQVIEDSVILHWSAPSTGASRALTGYYIYRNGNLLQSLANPAQLSYTDSGVPNGAYSYYLRAVYGATLSEPSNTVSLVVDVAPDLFPPTNLRALIIGERDIELQWDAPQGSPVAYLVYRNGSQIGSSATNSFYDANLANGAYQYYIRAQYPEGLSAPGNSVPVNIMYAYPPSGLTATVQNQTDISLSWIAPNQGEIAYLLYVNNVETAFIGDPQSTAYLLEDLPNGLYEIYLKAVYPAAISVPGNIATASIEVLYHPGGFDLEASGRTVQISWEPLENLYGFQHYLIYRNSTPYQQLVTPGFTDTNLPNGLYVYQLAVEYSFGTTELSPAEPIEIQVAEAPQNLQASITDNSILLSWEPSADTGYLQTYKLFHNGVLIGSAANSPYNVTNLPNGEHSFYVVAAYSFGDSQPSNPALALVEVAYPPANLSAQALQNTVTLSWSSPPAHALAYQFLGYRVYRNGTFLIETTTLGFNDMDLENGDYFYETTALYAFGESLPISAGTNVFITYPPTDLVLSYSMPNSVSLAWSRPQMGESGFRLYRNEFLIAEMDQQTQAYNDNNLPNGIYNYRVSAVFDEVESALSNQVVAHIAVAYSPHSLSLVQTASNIELSWNIADTGLLSHYLIYRNEVEIGSSTQTQFNAPIPPNGMHTFYVVAVYEDDLLSAPSNFAHINIQISYPVTLSGSHSGNNALLNWTPITDPGGFLGYYLYCDGLIVYNGPGTSYYHQNIINGEHNYHVIVRYQWGDSVPSNTYSASIWVPNQPSGLSLIISESNVQLNWTAPSDTNRLLGYRITRNGTQIAQIPETGYLDANLPNGAYTYQIRAIYEFGNSLPITDIAQIQVAYPATQLFAIAVENDVELSWTAVLDAGYFQHYSIYRDAVLIGTADSTFYQDQALPIGTYTYYVVANYAFGDAEPSNQIEIVLSSSAAPTNLQVEISANTVELSWSPVGNPEPADFVNYLVYRNNTFIGSTTEASFTDPDLRNGQYTYTVVAHYTTNTSEPSNVAVATIMLVYPPRNLQVYPGRNFANLTWDEPIDTGWLSGYLVIRNGAVIAELHAGRNGFEYTDLNLSPGSYSYGISSVYGDLISPPTVPQNPEDIIIEIEWPYTPQNLSATILDNAIQLSWTPVPADSEFLRYNVFMNGTLSGNTTNPLFLVSSVPNGSYSFRVSAQYQTIESPQSDASTLQYILPRLPENFSASLMENFRVRLDWQMPQDSYGFSAFILKRQGSEIYRGTATTFLDEYLPNGNYTYSLQSVYGEGVSPQTDASIRIAHIAGATNVVATAVDEGFQVSFAAPDLLFAPDYYSVYFIPNHPNTPIADWVFVESKATPGTVLDTVHGGIDHGNFTWAVVCGWHGVFETGTTYSNSIFVERIPEYNYLVGNHPNPFNPSTNIVFWLKDDNRVRLKIYNNRGQLVRNLFSGDLPKGTHTVVFDGKDDAGKTLNSGIYIYRMEAKGYSRTRKMMLSK